MTSSFAADLATILAGDGVAATLRTYTSAYDPATGANTNTATDTSVKVAISAYTTEEIAGGLVERGDMKGTIPAAGLTAPTTSAKLVVSGVEWSIKSVTPRYGGGSVISYALQLGR